jgi:pyrroline-5-carboxylate reductase
MRVSFIGAGKMSEAMIASLIKSKEVSPHKIFVSDINRSRRDTLKRKYGVNVYSKNQMAVGDSDVVFLAVKPQELKAVLSDIAEVISAKQIVVSIAAGKTIKVIEGILEGSRVVRVMPNLACLAGEAMSVYCGGNKATQKDVGTVAHLLRCFGRVLELPERAFDAVTAISGSGPAFFTYISLCMVEAGVSEGLKREEALLLAEQTMLGTGKLLLEKGMRAEELIQAVSSAKGTTEAGMKVLGKPEVARAVAQTIRAASERSKELSS